MRFSGHKMRNPGRYYEVFGEGLRDLSTGCGKRLGPLKPNYEVFGEGV